MHWQYGVWHYFLSVFQARITQKEETIAKYQELLSQAREDMAAANKRHEMEMNHLQQKLHSKTDAAFTRFKQSAVELVSKADKPVPSNDQVIVSSLTQWCLNLHSDVWIYKYSFGRLMAWWVYNHFVRRKILKWQEMKSSMIVFRSTALYGT